MIGVDFSSVNTMLVVIKIIERCNNPSLAIWRSFRNVCIKKMHDICMREAGTKFQLSHIDDVGEGGGGGGLVYLRRE